MNAIVGLGHFCEIHGPSVLYCTQTFHATSSPQRQPQHHEESASAASCCVDESGKPTFYGAPYTLYGADDRMLPRQSHTGEKPSGGKGRTSCNACNSVPETHRRLITNDHQERVSYISGKSTLNPGLCDLLQHAAMRSLSCEVVPGRDGNVYFGDKCKGYVLSRLFTIKDSQARGFQRLYCIFIVSKESTQLLSGYRFLTETIDKIVVWLRQQATVVYDAEQSEGSQRAKRIQQSAAVAAAAAAMTSAAIGESPLSSRVVRRGSGSDVRAGGASEKSTRSLQELSGNDGVYLRLHQLFVSLLRLAAMQFIETLPSTPKNIIMLDENEHSPQQRMTTTHTGECRCQSADPAGATPIKCTCGGKSAVDSSETPTQSGDMSSISDKLKTCLSLDDDDAAARSDSSPTFNILELYSLLGRDCFQAVCHQLALSRKVTVHSGDRRLLEAICNCYSAVVLRPLRRLIGDARCEFKIVESSSESSIGSTDDDKMAQASYRVTIGGGGGSDSPTDEAATAAEIYLTTDDNGVTRTELKRLNTGESSAAAGGKCLTLAVQICNHIESFQRLLSSDGADGSKVGTASANRTTSAGNRTSAVGVAGVSAGSRTSAAGAASADDDANVANWNRVVSLSVETVCLQWVDVADVMTSFARNCPWIGNSDLLNFVHSLGGRDTDLQLLSVWDRTNRVLQK